MPCCALPCCAGNLVSNAPHLPVHLGAMSEAVKFQIRHYAAGDGAAEGLRVRGWLGSWMAGQRAQGLAGPPLHNGIATVRARRGAATAPALH